MKYDYITQLNISPGPCYCIGPQEGEPLCPCLMKQVGVKNSKYVTLEQDLGPVPKEYDKSKLMV
jgi:hypothetical protein